MRASSRLLVAGGLLLVAVMVVAGAAVLLQTVGATHSAGSARAGCSPAPCVAPQGMELHIDGITRSGADVVLRLHVVNNTRGGGFEATSVRHTGLDDFSVRAGSSQVRPDVTDSPADCARWDDLRIARGASSPERSVCFRVPTGAPMTLSWSPDLGLVFRSVDLSLGKAP